MDAGEKAKEYFSIFVFKVEPCSQKTKHPWDSCDYCHPQENARRRDVRKYRYLAEACPDYKLHGFCALGNDCPFAHGVFEINLHPSKYRTQMCTEGPRCKRKVCFFAHSDAQLRQPDYRYGYRTAAEAESVKERLLAEANHPQLARTRAASIVASPLQRVSPSQVAPGTPPQATPPPRLGFNTDRVGTVTDAFRSLPGALPNQASPTFLNRCDAAYPLSLLDLQSVGSWTRDSELDAIHGIHRSQLADALPPAHGSLDLATAQYLRSKASQQTRSLPADGGPRISMKVRRELGLEPPAKNRTHSVPASITYGQPANLSVSTANLQCPASSLGSQVSSSNAALRGYIAAPPNPIPESLSQVSTTFPALPALKGNGLAFSGPLLTSFEPLRTSSPVLNGSATLRVVAPDGKSMGVEEAMADLGLISNSIGSHDLGSMASALSILSRLGYSLASESGSPAASDGLDRERISEESTPTALLSHVQPLNSFATQLNLNHGSSSILSAAASAPGLAGLGLSAGSGNSYNLFN